MGDAPRPQGIAQDRQTGLSGVSFPPVMKQEIGLALRTPETETL